MRESLEFQNMKVYNQCKTSINIYCITQVKIGEYTKLIGSKIIHD